jgi:hypothetical protein
VKLLVWLEKPSNEQVRSLALQRMELAGNIIHWPAIPTEIIQPPRNFSGKIDNRQ